MNCPKASRIPLRHAKASAHVLTFGLALRLFDPQRSNGDNHIDLKREWYDEDHHRIHVDTSAAEAEAKLTLSTVARAKVIYDSISGASPNGLPPPPGSNQVPVKELTDIRRAVEVELEQTWGLNALRPSFAYSIESDYESYAVGYTHSIEFNQKNTRVTIGAAGTFDKSFPRFVKHDYKKSGDWLLGVSQLLGPTTILTVNFSAGLAHGYLADPYKRVHFTDYPDPNNAFQELRPRERVKELGLLSLQQFVSPLRGSAELEYRLYHDSYGIWSHTAELNWRQKVGQRLLLSPMLRFYQQSAASFYVTQLPGDPSCPVGNPLCPDVTIPTYYSADYRLSALHTWTYGLKATLLVTGNFSFDLAYKRYTMRGDDHVTSQSAYPSANILTGGLTIWF